MQLSPEFPEPLHFFRLPKNCGLCPISSVTLSLDTFCVKLVKSVDTPRATQVLDWQLVDVSDQTDQTRWRRSSAAKVGRQLMHANVLETCVHEICRLFSVLIAKRGASRPSGRRQQQVSQWQHTEHVWNTLGFNRRSGENVVCPHIAPSQFGYCPQNSPIPEIRDSGLRTTEAARAASLLPTPEKPRSVPYYSRRAMYPPWYRRSAPLFYLSRP